MLLVFFGMDMDDIFTLPIMMLSFLSCLFPRKYIVCVGGGSFSTPFSKTAAAAASATCCTIEDIAVFIKLLSFIVVGVVIASCLSS